MEKVLVKKVSKNGLTINEFVSLEQSMIWVETPEQKLKEIDNKLYKELEGSELTDTEK